MRKLFYFLTILLLFSLCLNAQNESIEWYRHEDGLPNDLVKAIVKDSSGYIWVATDDGIVKLEGRNFIQVTIPPMFSNNFKNILFSSKFGLLATSDPGLMSIKQNYEGIDAEYFTQPGSVQKMP